MHFYFKKISTSKIEETIIKELDEFKNYEFQYANKLLILLMDVENFQDSYANILLKFSKEFLLLEKKPYSICDSFIIALYSKQEKSLYIVPSFDKETFYYKGYKIVKNMFNIK